MKKPLLFILCAFISFSAFAQITELIKNGDFSLPNDAAKHLNINEITYWNSDDNTSNNTGREASGVAFTVNAAGSIYQVLGIVPDVLPRYIYNLSASVVWDGSANDTVYLTTYLSAFSGTNRTSRVRMDSVVTLMVCTGGGMPLTEFTGELAVSGAANPGDSLVFEFDVTGSKKNPADNNIWVQYDDVSLSSVIGIEIIKGGNMEDSLAWNRYWTTDKADKGTWKFNYTTEGPTEGDGGCLNISGSGQVGACIWQPVNLSPGHKYSFSGAFKYASVDSSTSVWVELMLAKRVPGLAGDYSGVSAGSGEYMFSRNSWMADPELKNLNVDGLFQDKFVFTGASSSVFVLPDTTTITDWYVVIKAGSYNTAGTTHPSFTFLFDEISLEDVSVISVGGNMEDSTQWNFYWGTNGSDKGTHAFNYTTDLPAAGEGGCYRVSASGQAASFIWQPVTIIPGHQYSIEGAFKNISVDAIDKTWVELFLTRVKPTGGDVNTGIGYSMNTWHGPDTLNFDGTFQDNFLLANTPTKKILIPDTVTQTEWYLVSKAGVWNDVAHAAHPAFDFLFDEIYLYDLGEPLWTVFNVAKIVDGTVDSPADFATKLKMKWDADSVYLVFDVIDDSINTNLNANIWENDNVEVYFDMRNTKIQNWPRDNGWPMPYTSGADGNYQLRMVHDSAWAKYNGTMVPGTNLDHALIDGGYQLTANLPWKELDSTFVPASDALIGFDVLASDNDAVVNKRNQVSFNAPNTFIWIDPAQWATLRLVSNGTFDVVPDAEKPTNPANVVATVTGANVALTWDASTDNRVVQQYIIFRGSTAIDTILAKLTGNSYAITALAPGDYTFGVTAMDIYGNKSSKASAPKITIVSGIEDLSDSHMMVYPNPSNGIFNIKSESNASVSLEVYNITGGLVTSAVFAENYVLDLSSYNKGVYFLHLKAEGKTQIAKLIIQ